MCGELVYITNASIKWIKPEMRYGGDNGVNLSEEWVAERQKKAVDMILVVSHPTEGPIFSSWNSFKVLPELSFQSMRPLADLP